MTASPTETRTDIDVVVTAFNGVDLTRSCLSHLAVQSRPHTAILVDNGSTDGTAEIVAAEFPGVRIIRLDDNLFFSSATNIGVAAGDGQFVVLMNNDVTCPADFLDRLITPLETDTAAGSSTALILQAASERVDSLGLASDRTLSCYPRRQGLLAYVGEPADPVLLGPAGTAAAYRRQAWEEIGGLDEHLPGYMEDFDLAMRLRVAGWTAAVAPDAIADHLGSATFGRRSSRQRWLGAFGRAYLTRRYRLLTRRYGAQILVTEALVVVGDTVIHRDLAALRGRIAGWRAARGLPPKPAPPVDAIEGSIGFVDSIRRRSRAIQPSDSIPTQALEHRPDPTKPDRMASR